MGGETIALVAQGGRVVLTKGDGTREEVDLASEGRRAEPGESAEMPEPVAVSGPESEVIGAEVPPQEGLLSAPGASPLDDAIEVLQRGLALDTDEEDGPASEGMVRR